MTNVFYFLSKLKQNSSKKSKKSKVEKTEDENQPQDSKDVDMVAEAESKKDDETTEDQEEELRKREEYKMQERELIDEILKYSSIRSEEPLGQDRIYNRYWSFRNVNGLLVETDEDAKILAEAIGDSEIEEDFTDDISAKVLWAAFVRLPSGNPLGNRT